LTPLALAQGIVPLVCLGFMLLLGRPAPLRPTATELRLGGFLGVAAASKVWSVAPGISLLKALQLAMPWCSSGCGCCRAAISSPGSPRWCTPSW
jgi:hypothetical protein